MPLYAGRLTRRELLGTTGLCLAGGALLGKVEFLSASAGPAGIAHATPMPSLPAPTYNQAMGQTDASGFVASFPFQGGSATQVWCDTANGSSSYNGFSPYPGRRMNGHGKHSQIGATGPGPADTAYGPAIDLATILSNNSLAQGVGNQFFFAEGQTFKLNKLSGWGWALYHGNGAAFPSCWQSYDDADPLNTAKHGRAGTAGRGARPRWTIGTGEYPGVPRGDFRDYTGWALRGLHLVGGDGAGAGLPAPCLWENCVFDQVSCGPGGPMNVSWINPAVDANIVRFCSLYGQFTASQSHACGIFSSFSNLTVEDCIFWHCGWPLAMGETRDSTTPGHPDMFKHAIYAHLGLGTWAVQRRNVIVDSSAGGFSNRGNHLTHHNVLIDNPTPDFNGGASSANQESATGVTGITYAELMLGGADIAPGTPRSAGVLMTCHTAGSVLAHCLAAQSSSYGRMNNSWIMSGGSGAEGIPSFLGIHDNAAYHYAPSPLNGPNGLDGIRIQTGNPPSPLEFFLTDDTNNVNHQAASPMDFAASGESKPYQPLITAIGYPSKAALIAAMIADPSQPWAYRLIAAASTAFGWNADHTLPVAQAMQLNFMVAMPMGSSALGHRATHDTATTTSSIWNLGADGTFVQQIHNIGPNPAYVRLGRGNSLAATTADKLLPVGATIDLDFGRSDWTFTDPSFPTVNGTDSFAVISVGGPTAISFPPLLISEQFTGFPGGQFAPPRVTYTQSSPVTVTEANGAVLPVTGPSFDYIAGSNLCRGLLITATNSAKMIGRHFTNWWKAAAEGAFVIFADSPGGGAHTVFQVDDGTQENRITCQTIGNTVHWVVVAGGAVQASLVAGPLVPGKMFMTACSFQAASFAACVNGGAVAAKSAGRPPERLAQAHFGNDLVGNALDGHVSFFSFYPRAVADAFLLGATRARS